MTDRTRYDFDAVVDRRDTHAAKWEAGEILKGWGLVERFDAETIPLFVADMDLPCPRPVLDALHARVDRQILGYSLHQTNTRYLDAFVGWYARRHDWAIDPGSVVQCRGVVEALRAIIRTCTGSEDGVIIQPPVYGTFASTIEGEGRRVVESPLRVEDGRYSINFGQFEALAQAPENTLFLLCNPHSPVGRVWTADESSRLAAICARHGVLVVADEVHADLVADGQRFVPFATVSEGARVITCTSTNKAFNIAGLSCANIVIDDPKLRAAFSGAIGLQFPNPLTLAAVTAAYRDGGNWLDQVNGYIDGNMARVAEAVKASMPGVRFRIPEGTYSAWLDFEGVCRSAGIDPKTLNRRINTDANIVLEDGGQSGAGGLHHQRMCVACARPVLSDALGRLARAIDGWR